jgi:hypothetical protein
MNWGNRNRRGLYVGLLALLVASGCRTTREDVERWANTQQGPSKLIAVLTHDKYPIDLRVESALTLVHMKARPGSKVGIDRLVEALSSLPSAERRALVAGLLPKLKEHLAQPATPVAGKENEGDPTIAYKDAAYGLLTNEGSVLIEEPADQAVIKQALVDWAMADFLQRMNAPSQKVSMQQMLRHLGPPGVKGLPALIVPEGQGIDRICALIAELGDAETKLRASGQLAAVASEVASPAWLARKAPALKQANTESGIQVDEARFTAQLSRYQEEEMLRVFSSMKQLGGRPVVEYLLAYAADKARPETLRAGALAALDQNIDKNSPTQVEGILSIASASDTPDVVRDIALRRVGDMPRELVIQRLYDLFKSENWKVRWLAAELALKMSETQHLPEFMTRLGAAANMSISEPLRYGKLIGGLKGDKKPASLVDAYAHSDQKVPVRLSALGYYYGWGLEADLPKVERYSSDPAKVPACAKDAKDCEWKCGEKEVQTVGDYVTLCIKPAMVGRKTQAPAQETDSAVSNASQVGAETQ